MHPLRVARVDRLTSEAVAIAFEVTDELRERYRHRPGQHVVVLHEHAGDVVRRSYSICSPAGSGELRIAVKELPGGAFSPFANRELREGDVLQVMVPSGSFVGAFEPGQARRYGAVAAGSGITPILSLLATALEVEPRSRAALLYGNRTVGSTMFRAELERLRARHGDRLAVTHALSRASGDGALRGRIRPELLDVVFRVREVDEWFLCGPEQMMEETAQALVERGADPDRVHRELFHGAGDEPPDVAARPELWSEVRLRLDGEEIVLELHSRGEPILAAALAVRSDLPFACREAVCGTCRARVVEGEVAMDRCSALDRRERAAGYVLACQAHPVTPAVTLDFDA